MIKIELVECNDNVNVCFHYTFNGIQDFDVNIVYNTEKRLKILKRRDPEEYSRTPFVEQNRIRWETFINLNLKKLLCQIYRMRTHSCLEREALMRNLFKLCFKHRQRRCGIPLIKSYLITGS